MLIKSMIVNIFKNDFLSALSHLQNITSKKSTIAILSNILIETDNNSIILTVTDLEIGIKYTVPAEIITDGSITLPSRKLFEIVRESNDNQIKLELLKNNWVKITAGKSDYNLAGMLADEFPEFPEYDDKNMFSLDCNIFTDFIDKVIFSVAQEGESQSNLTGILVEKEKIDEKQYIKMISSDGHRLSLMEKEVKDDIEKLKMDKTILIPRKGMQEIRKFCEKKDIIKIGFEEKQAVFKFDDSLVIIRLMQGDFPDYQNIINIVNKDKYIEFDRIELMNSMKRMNIFTEDKCNAVLFNIDKNIMILSSQNMDIGNAKDEIYIEYPYEPLQLAFNGRYFVDVLQVMKSKKIKTYISSEKSPCLIQGNDDSGFLSIIMPMQI